MNIGIIIIMIIYGLIGGLSTLFLFLGMPGLIIWKIYRRIKYHTALTD
ncbi:hypothetical protein [Clostridium sp. chh4-2]|nr:hypothetical protein [Clostridium sp. chh4-2]